MKSARKSVFLSVLLAFLLSGLVFAESACAQKCAADRDYWTKVGADNAAAKAYYCGVSSTNCVSRSTTPAGQSDPCWKMCTDAACVPWSKCDAAYQACCAQSAEINAGETYTQCLANCPQETTATPEATQTAAGPSAADETAESAGTSVQPEDEKAPTPAADAAKEYYSASFQVDFIEGDVTITDKNGKILNPALGDEIGPDATIACGKNGNIRVKIKTPNGLFPAYVFINPGTTFKFFPGAKAMQIILASSEHASIRGTINGGGDFIKGMERKAAFFDGAARLASLPSGGARANGTSVKNPLVLSAALPSKTIYVVGLEDGADFEVSLDGEGNVNVRSHYGKIAAFDESGAIAIGSKKALTIVQGNLPACDGVACEKKSLAEIGEAFGAKTGGPGTALFVLGAIVLGMVFLVWLFRKFLWMIIALGILAVAAVVFLLFFA